MELVAPKKSNKEAMQELMDRLQDHKAYFNYCLKIQELGTKKLIPFKMNSVQKILHEVAQQHRPCQNYCFKGKAFWYLHVCSGENV